MPLRQIRICLSAMLLLRTSSAETQPPKPNYVEIFGVRLPRLNWGGRWEPLVLAPGRCQAPYVFADLPPLLTRHFRVVGLTPRGCGHSETARNGYNVDRQIGELVEFLDTLGIRQATFAGHSSGRGKVVRLARRYPLRVNRIVTFDTIYRCVPDEFKSKMNLSRRWTQPFARRLAGRASCRLSRIAASSPHGSWGPGQRHWHASSASRRRSDPMAISATVPNAQAGSPALSATLRRGGISKASFFSRPFCWSPRIWTSTGLAGSLLLNNVLCAPAHRELQGNDRNRCRSSGETARMSG